MPRGFKTPDVIIWRILELLEKASGSQEQIAALVGVSEMTVHRVSIGRLTAPKLNRSTRAKLAALPVEGPMVPSRCPTCGVMVWGNCVACRVRPAARPVRQDMPAVDMSIAIRAPAEAARYEATRSSRERHERRTGNPLAYRREEGEEGEEVGVDELKNGPDNREELEEPPEL